MPEKGEIKKGNKRPLGNRGSRIWHACVDCGKTRWVSLIKGEPRNLRCSRCASNVWGTNEEGWKHPNWKGGRIVTSDGYIAIHVLGSDMFASMAGRRRKYGGYVLEHRLVMARHLGRCLKSWEIVHHLDGNKINNELSNLHLTKRMKHKMAYGDAYQAGYKQGYADAKAEVSFS